MAAQGDAGLREVPAPAVTRRPGLGIQIPNNDPLELGLDVRELARAAEAAGFDSLWIGDHLAFHCPILESVVSVAAASAVTSTIGVGFGVLLLPLRPLAWIGKHVSSLQVLSGDRILLGVGVGGEHAPEYAAAGVPTRERGRRTDRALEALNDLLQGRPAYDATLGVEIPPLLPHGAMPPVWVGGRSDPALRRAARFGDGWWGIWMDPERVVRAREQLTALAAAFGRPAPRIGTTVFVNAHEREETAREQAQAWLESQYGIDFGWVEKRVAYGAPGRVAERLAELREAGVEDFGLIVAAPDPREQFETLAGLRDQLRI